MSVLAVTDKGYSGISHHDGAFIIADLPADNYDISFIRYGYVDSLIPVSDLSIENRAIGEVILRNGLARVHGYVRSPEGTPVPNATVVLADHPYSTKTDSKGFFSLGRISPEISRIMAASDDFGWGQALLSLVPGSDFEVTIYLHSTKTGTIRGIVYDEDGEPDSGAVVISFGGMVIDTAFDGTYTLNNLPCAFPLNVSSGVTHNVSSILIPENDTVVNINLNTLEVSNKGDISIVERQVFTLQSDSIIISADVRNRDGTGSCYDSVAVFLWKVKKDGRMLDTSTSSPFLPVPYTAGMDCEYGIITIQNDTLPYVPVHCIEIPSISEIHFVESSISPVDTTLAVSDSVKLCWRAYDSNGRPLQYSVYFGGYSVSPPSFYRGSILDTCIFVKPVEGWRERKYRWQLEARSSRGTLKTAEFVFTIAN